MDYIINTNSSAEDWKQAPKITPYKGNKPYIFVSYAHKDINEAMAIISELIRRGYRIWYDEGIDPGTEWDDNIAVHVEKSSMFIALISNNYLASSNCRDELSFARELELDRILVYLENVTLPRGMHMRLSRLQAIHKYTYQVIDQFYDKVEGAPDIKKCREESSADSEILSKETEEFKEVLRNAEENRTAIIKEYETKVSELQKRIKEVYSEAIVLSNERKIDIGEEVELGTWDGGPIRWYVIDRMENALLLLAKNGWTAGFSRRQSYKESLNWMNLGFKSYFSDRELDTIIREDGQYFSFLDVEQARQYARAVPAIKTGVSLGDYTSIFPWWLKKSNDDSQYAPIVRKNGEIIARGLNEGQSGVVSRPAAWIRTAKYLLL